MSLLEDLRGLDIGAITSARDNLSASVQGPELLTVLSRGPASSALGDLGQNLDGFRESFDNPEALLMPLMEALDKLAPSLESSNLPLDEYARVVTEGADVVGQFVKNLSGNPNDFGQIFGSSLGDALQFVQSNSDIVTGPLGAGADTFATLTHMVDTASSNPEALAELVVELLMPIPKANVFALRDGVSVVLNASEQVTLPSGRTTGLTAALDAITAAAHEGDLTAVDDAIRQFRHVRQHTIDTLRDDLMFAVGALGRLRIPELLNPLMQISSSLRLGEGGIVEFLNELRGMMAEFRSQVENVDVEQARQFLVDLPDTVESHAKELVEAPVNAAVERAQEWVRALFRKLPIGELRDSLTRFLRGVAQAIDDANLDAPVNTVRQGLLSVASTLSSEQLTEQVQSALQEVNETVSTALDGVIAPLETIATEVDRLAGEAEAIMSRLQVGLSEFQSAIERVTAAIEGLGIEQTEQEIVQALTKLRETAEDLLSNLPLPEPLRPQVEQLIALLEGIDLDSLIEPARNVAAELRVPDDVSDVVEHGLADAKQVIENLIPQQLIVSINAEVEEALNVIRGFNPASLLPDVSGYLEQSASVVEGFDPRPIAEQIRAPFQKVLDLIDRAHPSLLLAPVVQGYDAVLGSLPTPNVDTTAEGLFQAYDSAGRTIARGALEPVRRLTPEDDSEVADVSDRSPTAETPPERSEVRAGDAIRLLGYIPSKLRELLSALDEGSVSDVLQRIDAMSSGLAAQLRQVEDTLHQIPRRFEDAFEEWLVPVGPAQLRAQFALEVHLAGQENLQASLDVVALASPAALRAELGGALDALRRGTRDIAEVAGGTAGPSLSRAALALEALPLAQLTGDMNDLLAALDPEPIAAELDAIVETTLQRAPQLINELMVEGHRTMERLTAIVNVYNPGNQFLKFSAVLDVVREELNILNPRRLVDELGEIHAAIRSTVAAYDPSVLAEELYNVIRAVTEQLRALNPETLLGDIDFLQATVDRIAAANPAERLANVGVSLQAVGAELGEIDLDALIQSVNQLGPRLLESFSAALDAIRNEIVALLESLRFASGNVSASASVSIGS